MDTAEPVTDLDQPAPASSNRRVRARLVRDAGVGSYLEHVLIAAVVTILVTRGYLQATGFPQIGGGGLHIAHMLWGGLLMLLANVLLLAFLGRHIRRVSAFVAGIGFGLFIDELGKFITSNNDYFYQPTIGIMYLVMIVLFLLFRYVERRAPLSRVERVANAAETVVDVVIGRARQRDIRASVEPLEQSAGGIMTMPGLAMPAQTVRVLLADARDTWTDQRDVLDYGAGLMGSVRRIWGRVLHWRWLHRTVVTLFVVEGLLTLTLGVVVLLLSGPTALLGEDAGSFVSVGHAVASSIEFLLVMSGVVLMTRSRLEGYRAFRLSVLVSIFFVQGFLFFGQQLGALGGLAIDLLMLATLDVMIAASTSPDTAAIPGSKDS